MKLLPFRQPAILIGTALFLGMVAACDNGVEPPGSGQLSVNTVTSGPEPDSDGYLLSVDGGDYGTVASSGASVIDDVAEGAHSVLISGIAANCTVSGDNPATVSVVADQTAQVTFSIACSATTGSIEVTTSTTGEDLDTSYVMSVDGRTPVPVGGSDVVTIGDLAEGMHTLELTDVAENCSVTGANPRSLDVTAGSTASTTFEVSCVSATGDLEVTVRTTGQDLDPDGYQLTVDGASPQVVAIDETLVFEQLSVGPHQVELTGLAANCAVSGSNPRSVEVAFGVVAADTLEVTCTEIPVPAGRIVFHSDRDGDYEIYSANADGSNVIQLTDNVVDDQFPATSPDGQYVAFSSNRSGGISIWIIDADGSNPVQVTSGGSADRWPAWSPDGSRVAFARGGSTSAEIYTIRTDGTDLVRLTVNAFEDKEPAWSPDGLKIAFTSHRDGDPEVYTMNAADGSNPTNLTNHPAGLDVEPDWSPDGSLILFHRNDRATDPAWLGDGEIMCMAADGSGVIRMTTDSTEIVDWGPRWAPDGVWYTFTSNRDEGEAGNEIYTARANGCTSAPTSVVRLTDSPGRDAMADWFPQ